MDIEGSLPSSQEPYPEPDHSSQVFLNHRAPSPLLPGRELILKIHKTGTIKYQEKTNLFKKENIITIIKL
jgi:hypothetical protein